jgi:hypothetical protein
MSIYGHFLAGSNGHSKAMPTCRLCSLTTSMSPKRPDPQGLARDTSTDSGLPSRTSAPLRIRLTS